MKTLSRVPTSSSCNVGTDLLTGSLAQIGQSDNAASYFAIRNVVLVSGSKDRIMPVGLAITQVVVPKQLRSKILTVAHEHLTF